MVSVSAAAAAVLCASFALLASASCNDAFGSKSLPGLPTTVQAGVKTAVSNNQFDFSFSCTGSNTDMTFDANAAAVTPPSPAPTGVTTGACQNNVNSPIFYDNFLVAGGFISPYDASIVEAKVTTGCPVATSPEALAIKVYDPTYRAPSETCGLAYVSMVGDCNLDPLGPALPSGCVAACLKGGVSFTMYDGFSALFSSNYYYDATFFKPNLANCNCNQGNFLLDSTGSNKFGLSNGGATGGLTQNAGPAAGKGILMGPYALKGDNASFFYPIDSTHFHLDIDLSTLLTNVEIVGGPAPKCRIKYQVTSGACMGTVGASSTGLLEALLALSVGAIIGIAIGAAVLVLLIVVFITVCCCGMTCFLCAKRRQPVGIAKSAPVVRVQK